MSNILVRNKSPIFGSIRPAWSVAVVSGHEILANELEPQDKQYVDLDFTAGIPKPAKEASLDEGVVYEFTLLASDNMGSVTKETLFYAHRMNFATGEDIEAIGADPEDTVANLNAGWRAALRRDASEQYEVVTEKAKPTAQKVAEMHFQAA